MNVDKFLAHHGIVENPFGAEEARHDPVFERLISQSAHNHPDFAKILGQIEHPSTSVVFGEKGSGKTAIRLQIDSRVAEHNRNHPEKRVLLAAYDDLNPVIDLILQSTRPDNTRLRMRRTKGDLTGIIRLEDHQDAILSLATTQLINGLLDEDSDAEPRRRMMMPGDLTRRLKRMPREDRRMLAVLAALYDQPRAGTGEGRWRKVLKRLRLRRSIGLWVMKWTASVFAVLAVGAAIGWLGASKWLDPQPTYIKYAPTFAGVLAVIAAILGVMLLRQRMHVWSLARRIARELHAIDRQPQQLRRMLGAFTASELAEHPMPHRRDDDDQSRYELTARLVDLLESFDYVGLLVLVDRVDEPTVISGNPQKMRDFIWPVFDSKFLQQDRVGLKLLLPVELRHMLHRESAEFFQEARLDKQNLIDRLTWSGATLYDLCTERLRACQRDGADPVYLTDLFDADASRDVIVDSLDQMHQPRDAFKFLYQVIQEHCRMVPDDQAKFTIPRPVLDTVRKMQSQRVQELYRGLSPS